MASEIDLMLRELIDSVAQRPRFDRSGRAKQMVQVAFTTPHDFQGTVEMPLADWNDPETRAKKVMQAVIDLEGPFWDSEGAMPEGG